MSPLPYAALLLDLNGTFMFGHDRFGSDAGFDATYRELGGTTLSPDVVDAAIRTCLAELEGLYQDPEHYDAFPSLGEVFDRNSGIPASSIRLLVDVVARHECGTISPEYAQCVRDLSSRHRLALVSNIWSPKTRWIEELERAGVLSAFTCVHFSSDASSIKPAPSLFLAALRALDVRASDAAMVGDSLRCDIAGAQAVGIRTVWIGRGHDSSADHVVPDLIALRSGGQRPSATFT